MFCCLSVNKIIFRFHKMCKLVLIYFCPKTSTPRGLLTMNANFQNKHNHVLVVLNLNKIPPPNTTLLEEFRSVEFSDLGTQYKTLSVCLSSSPSHLLPLSLSLPPTFSSYLSPPSFHLLLSPSLSVDVVECEISSNNLMAGVK